MDTDNLHIRNGCTVALEFARQQQGRIVKTHLPEHGDITYDVQINYEFNPEAKEESIRVRDLPTRCLIWVADPPKETEE